MKDGWYQLVHDQHVYVEVYDGESKRYLNAGNRPGNYYGNTYTVPKNLPFFPESFHHTTIEVGHITNSNVKVYAVNSWTEDFFNLDLANQPATMIYSREDHLASFEKQKEDLILKTRNEETLIYELF